MKMLKFDKEKTMIIKKMLFQGWFHGMMESNALKIYYEAKERPEIDDISIEESLQLALEFHLSVEESFKEFVDQEEELITMED